MNRAIILKVVNVILAILFLNQALTGFFHHSLSHRTFETLHEGGAILLVIFTLAHLYLNWGWIKSNLLKI